MTPWSGLITADPARRPPHGPYNRRFAAAVTFSAALHWIFAAAVTGGPRARPAPAADANALAVSLVPIVRPAVAEATGTPDILVPEPQSHSSPQPVAKRLATKPSMPRVTPPVRATDAASIANAPVEPLDPTYYATRHLDVFPTLATPLQMGRGAAQTPHSARALLLVLIDATGTVNDVTVIEPTAGSSVEEEARRAFLSARFTPAYRNGRPVKSRMIVEVNYGAEDRGER